MREMRDLFDAKVPRDARTTVVGFAVPLLKQLGIFKEPRK